MTSEKIRHIFSNSPTSHCFCSVPLRMHAHTCTMHTRTQMHVHPHAHTYIFSYHCLTLFEPLRLINTYLGYLFTCNFLSVFRSMSLNRMLALMSKSPVSPSFLSGVSKQVGMNENKECKCLKKCTLLPTGSYIFYFKVVINLVNDKRYHAISTFYIYVCRNGKYHPNPVALWITWSFLPCIHTCFLSYSQWDAKLTAWFF